MGVTLVAVIIATMHLPAIPSSPISMAISLNTFQDLENCEAYKSSAEFAQTRNALVQGLQASYIAIDNITYECAEAPQ